MAKSIVGKVADLKPGTIKEVQLGGRTYAIANVGGTFYAIDGICGHASDGHLGQGHLMGETVKCPMHGAVYDMKTGKNLKKPWIPFTKAADLKAYVVRVEGDDVIIEI
jgi:nitrite reductase/ring-hydroxylating ferredoxin subunit